jgi:hypothetical protein
MKANLTRNRTRRFVRKIARVDGAVSRDAGTPLLSLSSDPFSVIQGDNHTKRKGNVLEMLPSGNP